MPAYKDQKHKGKTPWYVKFRYTDKEGNKKVKVKRGFSSRREAEEFEERFLQELAIDKDFLFEKVVEFYLETVNNRIKLSTAETKESVIKKFILPAFSGKDIRDITVNDLTKWQNKYLFEKDENGNNKYQPTYIKRVNGQLRAIFNFATKSKYLETNPVIDLLSVGKKDPDRQYYTWSSEDIKLFLSSITDYENAHLAFNILFYTGLRKGELLALTIEDFNYENKTLKVNKTFSRYHGKDYIRSPKTEGSNRTVDLPQFLADAIQGYIDLFYKPSPNQRIFQVDSDSFLDTAFKAGCKRTGLPRIRIHDTRHSHSTNLSEMDVPLKEIGKRLGQKSKNIVLHYHHSTAKGVSDLINKLENEGGNSNI